MTGLISPFPFHLLFRVNNICYISNFLLMVSYIGNAVHAIRKRFYMRVKLLPYDRLCNYVARHSLISPLKVLISLFLCWMAFNFLLLCCHEREKVSPFCPLESINWAVNNEKNAIRQIFLRRRVSDAIKFAGNVAVCFLPCNVVDTVINAPHRVFSKAFSVSKWLI